MDPEKKMPGYTGHRPLYVDEKPETPTERFMRDNRFYIPGKLLLHIYLAASCPYEP